MEGDEEPGRGELEGEAQAEVMGAAFVAVGHVLVVEVEVAGELLGGELAGVAPVGVPLLGGEEIYRYAPTSPSRFGPPGAPTRPSPPAPS